MLSFFYLISWYLDSVISGVRKPFNAIICIGDVSDSKNKKNFQKIFDELKSAYRGGARKLRFDGKPLSWTDDNKSFRNIVDAAQKIGFSSISAFWDTQEPMSKVINDYWITLNDFFDDISFETEERKKLLIENIAQAHNKNIYALYTINSKNYFSIDDILKFVTGNPKIKSIGFLFESDNKQTSLNLDDELKTVIINKLIRLKKQGFSIQNSYRDLINDKSLSPKYNSAVTVYDFEGNNYEIKTFSIINSIIKQQGMRS